MGRLFTFITAIAAVVGVVTTAQASSLPLTDIKFVKLGTLTSGATPFPATGAFSAGPAGNRAWVMSFTIAPGEVSGEVEASFDAPHSGSIIGGGSDIGSFEFGLHTGVFDLANPQAGLISDIGFNLPGTTGLTTVNAPSASIAIDGDGSTRMTAALAHLLTAGNYYLLLAVNGAFANQTISGHLTTSIAPVPLPATLPLFGAVIGCLGVFGYQRHKATTTV